jgi:hypothetical protein
LSHRFSPELLNFLSGLVYSSFPNKENKTKRGCLSHSVVVPPFKPVGPEAKILLYGLKGEKTKGKRTEKER